MIIEIIIRTGKGKKSKECEIDKTCDEVMGIVLKLSGKIIGGDVFEDGTSLIIRNNVIN